MAFKVQQHRTFVTMTDYHLKDGNLSIPAKGLQSWLLSNPKEWNGDFDDILNFHYGLTQTDLISILNELQLNGYITVKNSTYTVNEKPKNVQNKQLGKITLTNSANQPTPKKKSLYAKCYEFIEEFTEDEALRTSLRQYLALRMNPGQDSRLSGYPIQYFNQWRNILYTLDTLEGDLVSIVDQSTKRHWAKFVDIPKTTALDGVQSNSYTEEEREKFRQKAQQIQEEGGTGIF